MLVNAGVAYHKETGIRRKYRAREGRVWPCLMLNSAPDA